MKVQVIIESDGETEVVQEIATLNRGRLQPEELGLTLAEARDLMQGLQQTMVTRQIVEFSKDNIRCSSCGKPRYRKGKHEIVYRTLFGKLKLESPRYYECRCEERNKGSVSPLAELLKERTSPELIYLETKFASLMSYGLTVDLLAEVLPLGNQISTTAYTADCNKSRSGSRASWGKSNPISLMNASATGINCRRQAHRSLLGWTADMSMPRIRNPGQRVGLK
jgi:hypothetical protein